jgi:hypothetical protein
MPQFAASFRQRAIDALSLATAGDITMNASRFSVHLRHEWPVSRVELLYELAYVRLFVEWEYFLEETLLRYLYGYQSAHGICTPIQGATHFRALSQAKIALLGSRQFLLWHNPVTVTQRARAFLSNGFHETVIASNTARLILFADIRHRVVHAQDDAKQKFDHATMQIAGTRYRGARPGRFLRDWNSTTTPPKRWLEVLGLELVGLAQQIA